MVQSHQSPLPSFNRMSTSNPSLLSIVPAIIKVKKSSRETGMKEKNKGADNDKNLNWQIPESKMKALTGETLLPSK